MTYIHEGNSRDNMSLLVIYLLN